MKTFEELHKKFTLMLSDELSAGLCLNVDFGKLVFLEKTYQKVMAGIGTFSYVIVFETTKEDKERVVCSIDPQILKLLTYLTMGGSGQLLKTESPQKLTYSEEFFGKEIANKLTYFLKSIGYDCQILRISNEVKLVHSFYPDEHIRYVKIDCRIKDNYVGAIQLCYPKAV